MSYFYQDLFFIICSLIIFIFFLGYLIVRRQFRGGKLLLGLTFLLSLAGISDMVFRFNPDPNLVVLAEGMNVICFTFVLALLLNYSTVYFYKNPLSLPLKYYLLIYLPALIISVIYIFTPWMVSSITQNPFGFKISYNSGYWAIVLYGILMSICALLFVLITLFRDHDLDDKNEALFMMFILVLLVFFYSSVLILPFISHMVNFASPLPTTFAILALVYSYIAHGYFSLTMGEKSS